MEQAQGSLRGWFLAPAWRARCCVAAARTLIVVVAPLLHEKARAKGRCGTLVVLRTVVVCRGKSEERKKKDSLNHK